MDRLEAIAFALGVINVTLVVRRSIWNYPFGIAMVALYALIFLRAKLYSDALLQLFFLAINGYGWANWAAGRGAAGEVVVEVMTAPQRRRWAAGAALAALCWGAAMARFTDASFPWLDAAVALASVAAQLMMARRYLENWHVWIGVDLASVGLYAAKALWLTGVLYLVFLALALWGLIDWRRALRGRAPRAAAA